MAAARPALGAARPALAAARSALAAARPALAAAACVLTANERTRAALRAARRALAAAACAPLAFAACRGSLDLVPSDAPVVLAQHVLDEAHPGRPGPHAVRTLYYGSGTDRNRPEYRDSVAIVTEPVDASKLVSLGSSAKSRNRYWGFSPDSFPLNARVWLPAAPGPHPLVLVVHGNHDMRDFSDPGYDWLGELLASRGYVLASVDMNFVNGGIRGENDARGWLLLKHLEAWRAFTEDEDGPLHGVADMSRIALIGHSRGGEAVGHAAAFNRLKRYPDDASLEFDFGFAIRAVVAIAPVDGQYLPADQRAPVENVNYLVFHGSHDGDVTSFHGLRQFNRVRFDDGGDWFKSAVYVYRANHGQWNTVWGAHDNGPRSGRILDLRGLLPAEEQREFGRVFVSAFLEIALKGDDRYRPLFRDHRVAGGWLPKTMYVTRFEDASFRPLADFEEDIDLETGTAEGVALMGEGFGTWREGQLDLRSANRSNTSSSQLDQALWLGWNNAYEGSDAEAAPPATFSVSLPPGLAERWRAGAESTLELHVAGLDDEPEPRERPDSAGRGGDDEPEPRERPDSAGRGGDPEPRDDAGSAAPATGERAGSEDSGSGGDGSASGGDDDRGAGDGKPRSSTEGRSATTARDGDDSPGDEKPPLDLTVEAEDADGDAGRVALSGYGPLRRPLTIRVYRRSDRDDDRFANRWETILQHFSIPLSDFALANPAFDPETLRSVRLVFDRTQAGTVVIDDIGLSRMHPAFLEARIPPAAR